MKHFLFLLAIGFCTVELSTQGLTNAFRKLGYGKPNATAILEEFTDDGIVYTCNQILSTREFVGSLLQIRTYDKAVSTSEQCSLPENSRIGLCEYEAKGHGIFLKFTGIDRFEGNGHTRSHILIQDCKVSMFYEMEPVKVETPVPVAKSTEKAVTNSTEAYPEFPSSTYVPQ